MIRTRTAYQYVQGQATWRIESTGDGTGVSTLRMTASEDTTLRLTDNAKFYTDSAGTLGESSTWTITAGALQTIYLKCTSGSARLIIPQQRLITEWGNSSAYGWESYANAANIVSEGFPFRNLTSFRITDKSIFKWALSDTLIFIYISGSTIYWESSEALPVNLTYLYLKSNFINWTYYDLSGNGNMTYLYLNNFVTIPLIVSQLIKLFKSMANRVGDLPATCTINDYSNSPTAAEISAATPNETGTDAEQARYWINQIIANKTTTEILLMGVSIT